MAANTALLVRGDVLPAPYQALLVLGKPKASCLLAQVSDLIEVPIHWVPGGSHRRVSGSEVEEASTLLLSCNVV